MAGNVSQWVEDCQHKAKHFRDTFEGAPTDGSAWTTNCYKDHLGSVFRVLRGSAYIWSEKTMRTTWRSQQQSQQGYKHSGFRCARSR